MLICCNVKNEAPPSISLNEASHPVNLSGHRGNHIVTHTSPVHTTAKANRRQLIAEKGSFDGGRGNGTYLRWGGELDSLPGQRKRVERQPTTIFRAALRERRINVDRVSISGLPCERSRAKMLPIALVANNIAPVTMRETAYRLSVRRSSNADSYSQCFRQLDCILGLNKAKEISSDAFSFTPCPVGVCRIDWAAQLVNSTGIGVITFPVAKDNSHIPGRTSRDHVARRKAVRRLLTAWLRQAYGTLCDLSHRVSFTSNIHQQA